VSDLIFVLSGMVFTLLYFLPSAIAAARGKGNTVAIFALNLLAGWTFVGWVAALVWALTRDATPTRAA
jgi:hypothetical protein